MGHYLWGLELQNGKCYPLLDSLHCGKLAAGWWQTPLGPSLCTDFYTQLALRAGCCLRANQGEGMPCYPRIPKFETMLAQRDILSGNSCDMSDMWLQCRGLYQVGFDRRGH